MTSPGSGGRDGRAGVMTVVTLKPAPCALVVANRGGDAVAGQTVFGLGLLLGRSGTEEAVHGIGPFVVARHIQRVVHRGARALARTWAALSLPSTGSGFLAGPEGVDTAADVGDQLGPRGVAVEPEIVAADQRRQWRPCQPVQSSWCWSCSRMCGGGSPSVH